MKGVLNVTLEEEKLEQEIETLEALICEDMEKGIPVTEAMNRRIAQAMLKAQQE